MRVDEYPVSSRAPAARFDPLRYCIFTTVALLAWWLGPIAVAAMSALGLAAYGRAWRAGLRRSRCLLGDTRLVIAYLAAAFLGSTMVVVRAALA